MERVLNQYNKNYILTLSVPKNGDRTQDHHKAPKEEHHEALAQEPHKAQLKKAMTPSE